MFAGLVSMGAMSERNDDPERAPAGRSTPTGTASSSARARWCWSLESAEHAARRGAAPYAAVAGGALTCDAFHISAPDPSARATPPPRSPRPCSGPGSQPEELDYICAHGTSTAANDLTETRAIRAALGRGGRPGGGQRAEVDGRPPDRRGRRARRDGVRDGDPGRHRAADHQPATPRTRSATWTTCRIPPGRCRCAVAATNAFGFGGPELRDGISRTRMKIEVK